MKLENSLIISGSDALLIVDVQNDFTPGGALPVNEGDQIIPGINQLATKFKKRETLIVLTQDWHPDGHHSFASVHDGKNPFDPFDGEGLGPVLWPDHCIQGSLGAEFHDDLDTTFATLIIRKGFHREIDSYSIFLENDKKTETGLAGYLKSKGIKRVFLTGLALDFCVYYSAIDARSFGFETYVVLDLTRGIDNPEGNVLKAIRDMEQKGVRFVKSPAFQTG
ncbi:MAG: bifunctional nicotinamidase/pyrazinamidase [Candidatus Helarchaeota archaeon]